MLRKVFLCALVFLTAFAAAAGEPQKVYRLEEGFVPKGTGEKFVKALVNALEPEFMEVTLNAEPLEDGTLSHVHILARGISAGTEYRLDTAALTGALVKLTPPAQWDVANIKTLMPEKWEGLFNIEIVLKEEDARNAVKTYMKSGRDSQKWRDLSIDFRPGRLVVKGIYDINSGMRAAFEITTGLELRQGKQIWLTDTDIQINNAEQTDAIRSELKKINPPVDLTELGIPVTLRVLSITDKELRVRTATAPQPLDDGIVYRYSK